MPVFRIERTRDYIRGDEAEGKAAEEEQFYNTSVELVLSKMKHAENCIVKKGYFPDTFTPDIKDTFAFVSIDFDLYQPIYKALLIMWEHLSPGGYMMIHDYQNTMFPGSRRAVRQFCEEKNLQMVPLSDTCGSALIVKHKA